MLKRMLVRTVLSLTLLALGVFASACSQTGGEQELAGQDAHERHLTGLESQVGDY